jgi:hypothetical protein
MNRRDSAYVAGRKTLPCSVGQIKYKTRFQSPLRENWKRAVVGRKNRGPKPSRLYLLF